MSADVLAVANFFVELDQKAHPQKPKLTNMALQKLLYFAEGQSLGDGKSLFDNPIQAWEYGPVVPDAYHAFKHYGAKPIDKPASTMDTDGRMWRWSTPSLSEIPSANREREVVKHIYDKLGNVAAARLMAVSHAPDGPWAQVYDPSSRHTEIPRSMLREYFQTHRI